MLKVTGFSSEKKVKYASFLNHESNIVYFDLVSSLNQDDCVFINDGDTCLITISKQGDLIDVEIMGVQPVYYDEIDYPVVVTSFYGIPQIDTVPTMQLKTAPILRLSNNNEEGLLILGEVIQMRKLNVSDWTLEFDVSKTSEHYKKRPRYAESL